MNVSAIGANPYGAKAETAGTLAYKPRPEAAGTLAFGAETAGGYLSGSAEKSKRGTGMAGDFFFR